MTSNQSHIVAASIECMAWKSTNQKCGDSRHRLSRRFSAAAVSVLLLASLAPAQTDTTQTMRPVIRGRHAAVASMKAEATEAARRILDAGGNAFDAAVAGQAALAVSDFSLNGVGSDAVLLVYDSGEKKVYSINAEPRAPKLATIEWYQKNNGAKIPESDGLLSGGIPGVVDAWYILLDRWGTMNFDQVLQPAIDLAENGFPLSERGASYIAESKKILKYPTTVKIYLPDGHPPKAGDILKNPDLARTLKKLVEAEKNSQSKGRHEALKAARDRFYKGDIAHMLAAFSEANGGLFRYEDFADYTAKVETPVSTNYRGYDVYKNPSSSQGPTELIALNLLEGFDLKAMGHNRPEFLHTSVEAVKLAMGDREKYLGDMDFIKIPYDGLLSKDYAAQRRKLIDPAKASLELRPGTPASTSAALDRPVHEVLDGNASHNGDTSYIAVIDKDHNMVSFEPSLHELFGTGVVMGDTGILFKLPRRLLLVETRRSQRTRTRQASAQHAAKHARDEGWSALGDSWQPRWRRSGHAHHADADQHDRFRHEHPAGNRGPTLVLARVPGVSISAHDVSRRHECGSAHPPNDT